MFWTTRPEAPDLGAIILCFHARRAAFVITITFSLCCYLVNGPLMIEAWSE